MTKILTYSIVTHQSLFRQAFIILSLILLEQFSSLAQSNLFGPQNLIAEFPNGTFSICVADLDEDEDQDLLLAFFNDDKIAWYENDGFGNFGEQNIISTIANSARSVFATDLDNDNDLDVISASSLDDKIAWYENDGLGNFSYQKIISTQADYAYCVFAADLDQDGDQDVLSASQNDHKVAWYENNGAGNFSTEIIISLQATDSKFVLAADLDGDGDNDVVSGSNILGEIIYYENIEYGNFNDQKIINTQINGATSVLASDIDGDGDQDVLSASIIDNSIILAENDGFGNFNEQHIITTTALGAASVFAADINGDGALEVLSASIFDDKIAFYENLQIAKAEFEYEKCTIIGDQLTIQNHSKFSQLPSTTFQWIYNNELISLSRDLDLNLIESGNHNLTLISCTVSSCDTITKVIDVLEFQLVPIPILLTNTPYTFTNTSINIGYWVWEFGDGGIEEMQTPTHTYTEPGIYELEVNIYNTDISKDCFHQLQYMVTVEDSITGITDLPSNSLIVHPNPADQYLCLSSPELLPGVVFRLYNLLGQELITHLMDSTEEIAIPLGELSEGIYFFKLSSSEVVHKIVVAH